MNRIQNFAVYLLCINCCFLLFIIIYSFLALCLLLLSVQFRLQILNIQWCKKLKS